MTTMYAIYGTRDQKAVVCEGPCNTEPAHVPIPVGLMAFVIALYKPSERQQGLEVKYTMI